jgi:Holliday junction resolvase RusA-like endonuclease
MEQQLELLKDLEEQQEKQQRLEKRFSIVPCAKPRMTQRDQWLKPPRPAVAKYFSFKDAMRLMSGTWELPNQFAVVFIMPMPKSWSKKKKKAMVGKPHTVRPDLGNLYKAFEDALRDEDSDIHLILARKQWGEVGEIVVHQFRSVMLTF